MQKTSCYFYISIYLTNSHVSIIIIGKIFNHQILKSGEWQVEAFRLHISPGNTSRIVNSHGLGEVDRQQETVGALLNDNGVGWAVTECGRLVVNTEGVTVVET